MAAPVEVKSCSKCKRVLSASMFNKANWLPSGLRSDCKDRYKAFKAEWWAKQPKGEYAIRRQELKTLASKGLRRCKSCQEVLPLKTDNFSLSSKGCWNSDCRVCVRERTAEWQKSNPEQAHVMAVANCAARYAKKRSRTPRWLTREHRKQIREIYAECRRVSKATGIPHHVDHIIPLVGRLVSGLHVPGNLQIIPGSENCRKSNKWNF